MQILPSNVAVGGAAAAASSAPAPSPPAASAPPLRPVPAPAAAPPRSQVPRTPTMILEARAAAELIIESQASETLGEAEVVAAREVLQSTLLVPGATLASFAAFGHLG